MRWTEAQLAAHLAKTGVSGQPNTADTSDPPFAVEPTSKWSVDREIPHTCKLCSSAFTSRYPRHLYCEPCSESQDLKRKRLDGHKSSEKRRKVERRTKGIELSKESYRTLADPPHRPELEWKIGVCVPFSWSGSKNAIYSLRANGHVALRREHNQYRDVLILKLQSALRGKHLVQNKLWIDIYVEKSNHKGDAVNFVDGVCDAVKVATALDDRWFCIRNLDWSISKHEPKLFVWLGQENVGPVQACSYCGRLLSFDKFSKSHGNRNGISRVCGDCHRRDRVTVKAMP